MSKAKENERRPLVIELSRPLAVHRFHVVGQVGFSQRRDEIRAIMQLGVQLGGRLTALELSTQLLGGRTPAVGLRLLRLCKELGLVEWPPATRDRIAVLTEDGLEVADSGDVFVPERGTWDLWMTDDPLVPHEERLLRVEPFHEPRAQDDISKDPKREERDLVPLPAWVSDACDVQGIPYFGDGRAVSNIELEENAEEAEPEARVTLSLRLAPEEPPVVQLNGEVAGRRKTYELPEATAPSFDEVWRLCLGRNASAWDGRRLAVTFDVLNDDERRSFLRTMRFPGFTHPEYGRFGPFEVRGIPIWPASQGDASAWANWLLAQGVHGYVTTTDFRRRCEEVRRQFEGFRVMLKEQAELATAERAQAGKRPGRTYWHLQAPLDWAL